MELQHVNLKIYAQNSEPPAFEEFIPVFHSWIQDKICEELLIDVADYGHVPAGPGVMLIAHEANYSVEYGTEERFGVLYNTKELREGSNRDAINHALRQTLKAALRLEEDERLKGRLKFSGQEVRLTVNRRSVTPNEQTTLTALQPDIESIFNKLYSDSTYTLKRISTDPRQRFTVHIKNNVPIDIAPLLHGIESS